MNMIPDFLDHLCEPFQTQPVVEASEWGGSTVQNFCFQNDRQWSEKTLSPTIAVASSQSSANSLFIRSGSSLLIFKPSQPTQVNLLPPCFTSCISVSLINELKSAARIGRNILPLRSFGLLTTLKSPITQIAPWKLLIKALSSVQSELVFCW